MIKQPNVKKAKAVLDIPIPNDTSNSTTTIKDTKSKTKSTKGKKSTKKITPNNDPILDDFPISIPNVPLSKNQSNVISSNENQAEEIEEKKTCSADLSTIKLPPQEIIVKNVLSEKLTEVEKKFLDAQGVAYDDNTIKATALYRSLFMGAIMGSSKCAEALLKACPDYNAKQTVIQINNNTERVVNVLDEMGAIDFGKKYNG